MINFILGISITMNILFFVIAILVYKKFSNPLNDVIENKDIYKDFFGS